MSPEQLLRTYFHAKDEVRPHVLADVFASDARLEVNDLPGDLRIPGVTVRLGGIAGLLVQRFNLAYESVHLLHGSAAARGRGLLVRLARQHDREGVAECPSRMRPV